MQPWTSKYPAPVSLRPLNVAPLERLERALCVNGCHEYA
jgi:hypothetical protein